MALVGGSGEGSPGFDDHLPGPVAQPDQGDGDLRNGYVGVDARLTERWLAGVAVSRSGGRSHWQVGAARGPERDRRRGGVRARADGRPRAARRAGPHAGRSLGGRLRPAARGAVAVAYLGGRALGTGALWQEEVYRRYLPEQEQDTFAVDARGDHGKSPDLPWSLPRFSLTQPAGSEHGSYGFGSSNGIKSLRRNECDWGCDGRCDWGCDSVTGMRSRSGAALSL